MADNTVLNTGSGGDTIASDDIGGVKHQRVKIEYGVDGAAVDVSDTNPLPIDDAGGSLTVDATEFTDMVTSLQLLDNAVSGTEYQVDVVAALPAGDNNIGNVDLASAIPAGSNSIGTLGANSGVDIGDVDVTSVIPGTGATNLGKAIDSVVGGTDTGIAMLAKHTDDSAHLTTAEGDYDVLQIAGMGGLITHPEAKYHFDDLDATTGWTVLNDDAANLATTVIHATGTAALTYDKVNGTANTVLAAIQKTITTVDLGDVSLHDILQGVFCIPDLSDVDFVFLRLGTDASNYNEWQIEAEQLTANEFEVAIALVGNVKHTAITGNGWNPSTISYLCLGVSFNAETNTLSGIIFDQIGFFAGNHTSSIQGSEITSSLADNNINLHRIGGSSTDKGSGNASNGSQRVVIATDDVNQAAINTATAAMNAKMVAGTIIGDVNLGATDNAVLDQIEVNTSYGDSVGAGTEVAALRVTIANNSTGLLSIDDNGGSLTIDNADLGTIAGAVSGTEMQCDIVASLPAGTNAIGTLAANSGVDIGDVDVTSISAGTNLVGDVGISGARTSGGTTLYRNVDVDETEDAIKATAGQLYWIQCTNLDATPIFLQIYNATVASVTVGTTTADLTFCVPSQGDANGAGFVLAIPNGIAFSTAITIAATTTIGGSTGPAANEVILNAGYA